MTPSSISGRVVAVIYLELCLAVLAFGYVQQGIHDMPVAFTWFMIFLSFPVGFVVAPLVGAAQYALTKGFSIPYQPFWDLMPQWLALAFAGYLQWFVLIPFALRKLFRARPGV